MEFRYFDVKQHTTSSNFYISSYELLVGEPPFFVLDTETYQETKFSM